MGVDQDRKHAQSFVFLNESHAAHVGSEVVNFMRAASCDLAVPPFIQVQREILNISKALIPVTQRLNIHRANALIALLPK